MELCIHMEDHQQVIDLKEYQPMGIPILRLLGAVACFSFLATAIYEYVL